MRRAFFQLTDPGEWWEAAELIAYSYGWTLDEIEALSAAEVQRFSRTARLRQKGGGWR